MELGALSRLCELHSSSANESRVRQALALACLSSHQASFRRRFDDMANAREGAQSARDSAGKGMRGKLKIFLFLVEIFLER